MKKVDFLKLFEHDTQIKLLIELINDKNFDNNICGTANIDRREHTT